MAMVITISKVFVRALSFAHRAHMTSSNLLWWRGMREREAEEDKEARGGDISVGSCFGIGLQATVRHSHEV